MANTLIYSNHVLLITYSESTTLQHYQRVTTIFWWNIKSCHKPLSTRKAIQETERENKLDRLPLGHKIVVNLSQQMWWSAWKVTGAKENELEAESGTITVNMDVTAWWQHDRLIIVENLSSLHSPTQTQCIHDQGSCL